MRFEPALESELKAIAALGDRVYPLHSAEATKYNGVPYLIYASSEGVRDKALGGYLDSKTVEGELNIIAKRYGDMKAITREVIALLIGFEGREIGPGGPFIEELTYQQPIELHEEKPDLHRCLVEFTAYFEEVEGT